MAANQQCSASGRKPEGPDLELRRCGGCTGPTAPRYCSKDCQIKAWKGGHKLVCGSRSGGPNSSGSGPSSVGQTERTTRTTRFTLPPRPVSSSASTSLSFEAHPAPETGGREGAGGSESAKVSREDQNPASPPEAASIPHLVSSLTSPSEDVQGQAALMLARLASGEVGIRSQIAAAGAIAPLVALLRSGHVGSQQGAAWALRSLATLKDVRARIIKAGAVAVLISLLRSKHESVQAASAATLGSLDSPGAEWVSEAVPPLAALLKSDSSQVQYEATIALAKISKGEDRTALAELAPSFVNLLSSSSVAVQQAAATALLGLSFDDRNKAKIVAAGALAPLTDLLGTRSQRVLDVAVAAFSALTQTEDCQIQMAAAGVKVHKERVAAALADSYFSRVAADAAGAIPALIRLLSPPNAPGVPEHATVALANLFLLISAERASEVAADAIPALVALLDSASLELQDHAARALNNLVWKDVDSSNQALIRRAGGVAALRRSRGFFYPAVCLEAM